MALRAWLKKNGLNAKEQGGNVNVLPTANADTLTLFQKGDIDGAWVPEPWGTRLIQEAGGKVYLDERDLWPNGDFVTTHLIVRAKFLDEHPDVIEKLVARPRRRHGLHQRQPLEAKALLNRSIEKATTAALPGEGDRRRLGEPEDHLRPHRLQPEEVGRRRLRARLPGEEARPHDHLRPQLSSTRC